MFKHSGSRAQASSKAKKRISHGDEKRSKLSAVRVSIAFKSEIINFAPKHRVTSILKGVESMKRFLLIPILIVTASSLALSQTSGAEGNPLAGIWKANLSKSKQHANHQFQSATLRFEISDDTVLLTFTGVNMSGQQESGTRKLHPDGKEYPIAEVPGVVEVARWVNSRTLEMVAKKDGKVIGEGTYQVSSDGKTLTATIRGTDGSGAEFEQVIVFDRE
ncbi:MAG: hypothetical protein AB1631_14710 [Acidobacteriota bacterium]